MARILDDRILKNSMYVARLRMKTVPYTERRKLYKGTLQASLKALRYHLILERVLLMNVQHEGKAAFALEDKNTITKTRLYSFDPLKPHFYTVKLGFTGVYVNFIISAQKHRLWVFVRTALPRRF